VKELTTSGATLYLKPRCRGTPVLTARLGGVNGPLLASREVSSFTLDNTAAYWVHVHEDDEGGGETHGTRLTMTPLVADGSLDVVLTMRSPGMTFDNGLSSITFNTTAFAAQPDGSGVLDYAIHMAPGYGSFCMDVEVVQHASPGDIVAHRLGDNGKYCTCDVNIVAVDLFDLKFGAVGMEICARARFTQCAECIAAGHGPGVELYWALAGPVTEISRSGMRIWFRCTGEGAATISVDARCQGCTDVYYCALDCKSMTIIAAEHRVLVEHRGQILGVWKSSCDAWAERGGVFVSGDGGVTTFVERPNTAPDPRSDYQYTDPPLQPGETVTADLHTHPSTTDNQDGPSAADMTDAHNRGRSGYVVDGNADGGQICPYNGGSGVCHYDPVTMGPAGDPMQVDPANPPAWAVPVVGGQYFDP
jgi:hypothetical protein